jgi:hypothetical protein
LRFLGSFSSQATGGIIRLQKVSNHILRDSVCRLDVEIEPREVSVFFMPPTTSNKTLTRKQIAVLVLSGLIVVLAVVLNFLSQLSKPNSISTLILNTLAQTTAHFLSLGGVLIVVVLASLFALFRQPRLKGIPDDAQTLFRQAVKLESSYKSQEALAIYADIASRFPDSEVGRDAQISHEMLLKKIQTTQ